MKRYLLTILVVLTLALGPVAAQAAPAAIVIPTFKITAVERNTSVTIKTSNFPAGEVFTVTMGYYGTAGIGGVVVKKHDSGSGGSFTATFDVPASLHDLDRIAIRLYSPSSGYYAYNWFWNFDHPDKVTTTPVVTVGPGTPTPTPEPATTYPGYPPKGKNTIPAVTFVEVVKDKTVKVKGTNFTTNDKITVLLNDYGTLGVGGVVVGTVETNANGVFTATFDIPAKLQGDAKIAIRLYSKATGYYAYDWFHNANYP